MPYSSSKLRLPKKFLGDCLTNDLIPGFLQFRVPENGCFEETIVHIFQRRLLHKELAASLRAIEDGSKRLAMQLMTIAKLNLPEHIMRNVVFQARSLAQQVNEETLERRHKKLAALATRQDNPLRGIGTTVRTIGDIALPRWATDVLALGPKHPVRTKFNELHFLADADSFLTDLKKKVRVLTPSTKSTLL